MDPDPVPEQDGFRGAVGGVGDGWLAAGMRKNMRSAHYKIGPFENFGSFATPLQLLGLEDGDRSECSPKRARAGAHRRENRLLGRFLEEIPCGLVERYGPQSVSFEEVEDVGSLDVFY